MLLCSTTFTGLKRNTIPLLSVGGTESLARSEYEYRMLNRAWENCESGNTNKGWNVRISLDWWRFPTLLPYLLNMYIPFLESNFVLRIIPKLPYPILLYFDFIQQIHRKFWYQIPLKHQLDDSLASWTPFYWLSCSQDLHTVQLGGVQCVAYLLETYIPNIPFQERNKQRPLDHMVKKMTYLE